MQSDRVPCKKIPSMIKTSNSLRPGFVDSKHTCLFVLFPGWHQIVYKIRAVEINYLRPKTGITNSKTRPLTVSVLEAPT